MAGRRHLIACFSPKGGVGTTTIAVNIAMALAERAPTQVAIIDLDVDFGQVATHVNVKPRLTVADLAADDVRDAGAGAAPDLRRERSSPGCMSSRPRPRPRRGG